MIQPTGPDTPFQLLFSDETSAAPSLPESFRSIYPGDWHIPPAKDRPYTYTNFGMSRDGRISYNEPNMEEAHHVTKAAPHDRWLMGLLRMRAEALMIGDTTLRLEKYHFATTQEVCPWTAQFIWPPDADAFTAYRQAHGMARNPLLIILSMDGNVSLDHPCFRGEDRPIVFATTKRGADKMATLKRPDTVEIVALGDEAVDLKRLSTLLYAKYGIRQLLCEGGARVFAHMLNNGLVDEEFVTWCPTFVGRAAGRDRPSYTEGVAWMPESAPYSKPLTLHRGGDYLFLRTRCHYER